MGNVMYSSGEVAKMLGISQETLRYYEKQGIMFSEVDETNGYRWFMFRKVIALSHLRMFNHFGFPVKMSNLMVNGETAEDMQAQLTENEKQIDEQMEKLARIQKYSRHIRTDLSEIPQKLNQFEVSTSPALYHIKFQTGRKVLKDKRREAIIRSWYDKSPVVFPCVQAPIENFCPGYQVEIGFSVLEDDFDRWIGEKAEFVAYIPKGKSLRTVIEVPMDSVDFYEPMIPTMAYMKEHAVRHQNRMIAFPLAIRVRLSEDQPMKDYYQVFIPLQEE